MMLRLSVNIRTVAVREEDGRVEGWVMSDQQGQQGQHVEIVTSERVMRIEMNIQSISDEQKRQSAMIERQMDILDALKKQSSATDNATVAIRDRTENHNKIIEEMKREQVDIGKILEGFKVQLSLLRYVGGSIGLLVLGYLFSHFIPR